MGVQKIKRQAVRKRIPRATEAGNVAGDKLSVVAICTLAYLSGVLSLLGVL